MLGRFAVDIDGFGAPKSKIRIGTHAWSDAEKHSRVEQMGNAVEAVFFQEGVADCVEGWALPSVMFNACLCGAAIFASV